MPKKNNYKHYGFYKVTAFSPEVILANPQANAEKIISLSQKASAEQSLVCVFPELGLTGYTCEDLFLTTGLIKEVKSAVKHILQETSDVDSIVVFGAPYQNQDGRMYNCAFVCHKGKIIGVVPKTHIPNYSEFYERRWFSSGSSVHSDVFDAIIGQNFLISTKQLFTVGDIVLGVEICEDLWAPVPPSAHSSLAGANVILNLSASNELIGKSEYRRELVKQQSARLNCAYVYTSAGALESTKDVVFGGHMMIAENGSLLGESDRFNFTDQAISAEIDIEKLLLERRKNMTFGSSEFPEGFISHALSIDYGLDDIQRQYNKNPFVPSSDESLVKRSEEIFNIQSTGLARRMLAAKAKTLVLGLSGGLDSTLALLVCLESVKKLGKSSEMIKCITMPGFGTSDKTKNSAYRLASALNVGIQEIPISAAVTQHYKDIAHDPTDHSVVYENAQARERTQILFDMANKLSGIVVGTGDLSESALGWATFNGDHMSNYNVNASIPKTLVKHLVKHYADAHSENGVKEVLCDILGTVISPELLPPNADLTIAQSTEDLIGPYILHDFFLFHYLRNGFSPEKIFMLACKTFQGDYDKKIIKKWLEVFFTRFFSQQFKRTTMPPGPKVGSVAVSPRGDLRMPCEASININIKESDYE